MDDPITEIILEIGQESEEVAKIIQRIRAASRAHDEEAVDQAWKELRLPFSSMVSTVATYITMYAPTTADKMMEIMPQVAPIREKYRNQQEEGSSSSVEER